MSDVCKTGRVPAFCEIVWLVRYRAVERCPDGTGAAVRQEREPDRDRRNDGADRDGENDFSRGGVGLASDPGEEVAGGGDGHDGAGNGAG
jgi:hypothetical protein